jgi:prolyl-tRNA synthetase
VSTRLIGGVIMSHGDDDGRRLPPAIAPRQMVIVPMLRDKPEDAEVLAYCDGLAEDLGRASVRVLVVRKPVRSGEKRGNWVRRGAPVIVENGPRDAAAGQVTYMRRDCLRDGDRVRSLSAPREGFVFDAPALLLEIQQALYDEAKARLDTNVRNDIATFEALEDYYGAAEEDEDAAGVAFKGWVRAPWSRPSGKALDAIADRLKKLKLTLRNIPLDQEPPKGRRCIFTGEPAVEENLIGRAY